MEFRDSFSKLKKKVKHRLTGGKPKPDKTEADPTDSHSGSEPHVVAGGGHDQEGKELNVDGGQVLLAIRLPQPDDPDSVPACGSVNDQEGKGADVDGREGKDIGGEKVERIDPSPSTIPIPHDGQSDSA